MKISDEVLIALYIAGKVVLQPYRDHIISDSKLEFIINDPKGYVMVTEYNSMAEFSYGDINFGDEIVFRQYHSLGHVVRTTGYLGAISPSEAELSACMGVLDFFKAHGKPDIKVFIEEQEADDPHFLAKLQIASAFYSTGRESEIPFNHKSKRYWDYRKNSAANFRGAVERHPQRKAFF